MAGPWDTAPPPPSEPSAPPPGTPPAKAGPAPATQALACPSCGGTIELKAAGYTVTVVCQYCGSVLDVANPDVRIIKEYHEAAAQLTIPLGTRGEIRGIEWEAIGYLQKSEDGFTWEEYLLFNPYHGYRWLITDGRGWSFGTMLTRLPQSGRFGTELAVDGQSYRHFVDGRAHVDYVLGEFYWRVRAGDTVRTADYVRPGWMLSWEGSGAEDSWTVSELLKPGDVKRSFGAGLSGGQMAGTPMPHQPSPYTGILRPAMLFAGIAVAALFILTMLFGGSSRLFSERVTIEPDRTGRSITLGPIQLDRSWQAVTIEAQAPALDNAWVDLDYSLVDRKTQQSYDAYGLAERYSGYDSDGSWSEGSRTAATKMAMLPAGTYDLLVDAEAHNWTGAMREVEVQIAVERGATFWSNLVFALILILLPVGLIFWRHFRFETARLGESDRGATSEDILASLGGR
ncbi:protein of unknown function [Sphingomonas laterariae]|uniref:DUF4178 domain-containing protein n=1 Tax=Edaphosphingomonas laterariae TaxID=861865 RepID=A0A239D1F1_9SPHN|nr:DUF4178 domain-containing protein [Sphingomonas laterariae]SNS25972.1 protein of unknown function [Sphingomonas laterariae]